MDSTIIIWSIVVVLILSFFTIAIRSAFLDDRRRKERWAKAKFINAMNPLSRYFAIKKIRTNSIENMKLLAEIEYQRRVKRNLDDE